MIRAIIISPDKDLAGQLQDALAEFRQVGIARTLHQYPNEAKLPALMNATLPEMIFLSAQCPADATDVAQRVYDQWPGIPIVAINRTCDSTTMLEILRVGVQDFLALPFGERALRDMLQRVETFLVTRPVKETPNAPVFAFLPAKAGAGSTTIAVNTALVLARRPDTKTLLIDLDLNSGMVGFMMSLRPEFTVTDAAENAPDMDETVWAKLVTSVGNLDVLPAGVPKAGFRIDGSQIRRIIEFGKRNYNVVCIDLSGMMEKYSVELLQHVKEIFLVCTPELPNLHLARTKLELLRSLDLEDRVSILMNRAEKNQRMISMPEMEVVLRRKIFLTLPNAYETTRQALVDGKPIKPSSELGKCLAKLAHGMLPNAQQPATVEPRRSFLELLGARKHQPASSELNPLLVKVTSS